MRYLSANFRDILESGVRRPDYRIYAWGPTTVTISQIASAPNNHHSSIPEPLDLTPYAKDIQWTDRQLTFSIVDSPAELWHPDTGANRAYLKDGAILRLVEGDESLPSEIDWLTTFTGQIHGQVGWKKGKRGGSITARVSVFNRGETQAYKRRKITSNKYSAGTEIGVALKDIVETFMGLTSAEMRIPVTLGRQFKLVINQLAQVTPWDAICALLEVVSYVPYFDGEGRLTYVNKSLNRPMARVLDTNLFLGEFEVPERSQDGITEVDVTFLDANLTRVDGPEQLLGTAQVTSGFFSMYERLETWWSQDHKQRAYNTWLKIIKSVNSGLLPVGEESYTEVDEFHGQIDVEISVWVPILATVMLALYLSKSFLPDKVQGGQGVQVVGSTGITLPFGFTLSWGRIAEATAMVGILTIMMSLGSAQYEVWGTPYDYAYLTKMSEAIENGLPYWLINKQEIKNDFLGSHDQATAVAVTELIWQKVMSAPRRIVLVDDPSLEPGDIIGLPDGRKIVAMALSKGISRGNVPMLTVDGGKVFTA